MYNLHYLYYINYTLEKTYYNGILDLLSYNMVILFYFIITI